MFNVHGVYFLVFLRSLITVSGQCSDYSFDWYLPVSSIKQLAVAALYYKYLLRPLAKEQQTPAQADQYHEVAVWRC